MATQMTVTPKHRFSSQKEAADAFLAGLNSWTESVQVMADAIAYLDATEYNYEGFEKYESIIKKIRLISQGMLLPKLFVIGQSNPRLLKATMNLPIPEQEKVVANKPYRVAIVSGPDADAKLNDEPYWECKPQNMGQPELKQVFDKDHVRSIEEQIVHIRREQAKKVLSQPKKLPDGFIHMPAKNLILVRKKPEWNLTVHLLETLALTLGFKLTEIEKV